MKKYKCCRCGEIAKIRDKSKHLQYYCQDCVNKFKHLGISKTAEYSENGFNKKDSEKEYTITIFEVNNTFNELKYILPKVFIKEYENKICDIYLNNNGCENVNYNKFMSQVGAFFKKKITDNNICTKFFYDSFKEELKKLKVEKKSI